MLVHTWQTRDGCVLNIADMETEHIKNCLSLLDRNGFIAASRLKRYLTRTPPTSDAALDAFDREFASLMERQPTPVIDWFKEELTKRGETWNT